MKKRNGQKKKKRQDEMQRLKQLEEKQESSYREYVSMPGTILDIQRMRDIMSKVDFTLFFDTLDSRLDMFLRGENKDQCIKEWSQQETNLFLLMTLTLAEQKRFVASVFRFVENEDARHFVWTPMITNIYLHLPEITNIKTILTGESSAVEDELISKSVFISLVDLFSDAYIQRAIEERNVSWDDNAMFEIIGLLNRKSAEYLLTKLAIRRSLVSAEDALYYDYYMSKISFYVKAHINYYARSIEYGFVLPRGIYGAQMAYKKYLTYMEEQDVKTPLAFQFRGAKFSLKIKNPSGGKEEQNMKRVANKIFY